MGKRYSNLLAELTRADLSPTTVAEAIGVSVPAYYSRLNGTTKFKLADMTAIQDLIKKTTDKLLSLDYLFTAYDTNK